MNPVRVCPICGQSDDHPRHVIALPDGVDVARHMDCCALAAGCEMCGAQIAGANGATGDDLREHLLNPKQYMLAEPAGGELFIPRRAGHRHGTPEDGA